MVAGSPCLVRQDNPAYAAGRTGMVSAPMQVALPTPTSVIPRTCSSASSAIVVPARAARDHRRRARRARLHRRHADRRRQVADVPDPGQAAAGTVLVLSPLISLMKDQVDALERSGFRAAVFNSTLGDEERRQRLRELRRGELELLYVAPEALGTLAALDHRRLPGQPGGRRRGALHQPLGPRLPAGLPPAAATSRRSSATSRCWRSPPPPRAGSRSTSSASSACASRPASRARSSAPTCASSRRRRASGRNTRRDILGVVRGHPGESGIVYCASRKRRRGADRLAGSGVGMPALRITPGSTIERARATRTPSRATKSTSWWRRSRSAWASTRATCASSSTATCRAASRPGTRRSAAPAATACRATA